MKSLRSCYLFLASWFCLTCLVALPPTCATAARGVASGPGAPERSAKSRVWSTHDVGNLGLLVTNWGLIGSQWSNQSPISDQPSARWPMPNGAEYLFGGGLWVGAKINGEPYVSEGEYAHELMPGDTDPLDVIYATAMGAPGGNRYPWPDADDDHDGLEDEDPLNGRDDDGDGLVDEDFAAISNQHFECVLSDTTAQARQYYSDHTPLGIQVVQRSYQWSDADNDDYVGFDFTVRNVGPNMLDEVYIGFFADCDIGLRGTNAATDDMSGYWEGTRQAYDESNVLVHAGYMHDDDGDGGLCPGYFGVVLLDHATGPGAPDRVQVQSYQHFIGGVIFEDDGDPVTDAQRYQVLSTAGHDADIPSGQQSDYRFLISSGPFASLAPGQSISYRVALVVGEGLDGMLNNAANAVRTYQGKAYDRDGDPDTGPVVVHWLRANDGPAAAMRGSLAAQPTGAGARVELTASALGFGSLALERRAGDGRAARRWAERDFASIVREGDDITATVIDDEAVCWPRTYSLLLDDGGQEVLLDRIEVAGAIP